MSFAEFDSRFFECELHDDIAIARLRDAILNEELNIMQFESELVAVHGHYQLTRLILDMTVVRHLTSSVLGKIIGMHRRLRREGGCLVLCSLGAEVTDVLETSRLIDYFECADDIESAIQIVKRQTD